MSRLIVAKMIPGKFESMTDDQQDSARGAARRLFGYRDKSSEFQPTADVPFDERLASIQRVQPSDKGAGWIAIVSDEAYVQLDQFLENEKAFKDLFYIDRIHLNDGESTIDVYCNTSPRPLESPQECWGTGGRNPTPT